MLNLAHTGVVFGLLFCMVSESKKGVSMPALFFSCTLRNGCMLRLFWELYVCFHAILQM